MAATPVNSMNLNSTISGLVNWDGSKIMSSVALTQYSVLTGASANTVNNVAPSATIGYVLTSNGVSAQPSFKVLPFTQIPWTDEATSFAAVVGNGYFVTGAAVATLPSAPTQGNTIAFCVDGSVALTITANTGQYIQVGSTLSASAGTCVNAASVTGCSIILIYRASDSVWFAVPAPEGTWTIT